MALTLIIIRGILCHATQKLVKSVYSITSIQITIQLCRTYTTSCVQTYGPGRLQVQEQEGSEDGGGGAGQLRQQDKLHRGAAAQDGGLLGRSVRPAAVGEGPVHQVL